MRPVDRPGRARDVVDAGLASSARVTWSVDRTARTMILLVLVTISACGNLRSVTGAKQPIIVMASGSNDSGQLGIAGARSTTELTPVQGRSGHRLGHVVGLASGQSHSVAVLDDGHVLAWGSNVHAQLGDGTHDDSDRPVYVRAPQGQSGRLSQVRSVSADSDVTAAVLNDGRLVVWGAADAGQRGNGTTVETTVPTYVRTPDGGKPLSRIRQVSVDGRTLIALRDDGTVVGWGDNAVAEIGDGTKTNRLLPSYVLSLDGHTKLSQIKEIAMGGQGGTALRTDGTVVAWGVNGDGQLGDGTTKSTLVPVRVHGLGTSRFLSGVIHLASAENYNLALLSTGQVAAWGLNTGGQLGIGNYRSPQKRPVLVRSPVSGYLHDITAIYAGEAFTAAVTGSSTLLTWGSNRCGQLADGQTESRAIPGTVITAIGSNPIDARAVSVGRCHMLVSARE